MEGRPSGPEIEGARLFAARLEVSDSCDQQPVSLEDLAPLLALFARAKARQESIGIMADLVSQPTENMGDRWEARVDT